MLGELIPRNHEKRIGHLNGDKVEISGIKTKGAC